VILLCGFTAPRAQFFQLLHLPSQHSRAPGIFMEKPQGMPPFLSEAAEFGSRSAHTKQMPYTRKEYPLITVYVNLNFYEYSVKIGFVFL